MTTQPQSRAFTVGKCDRMVAADILTEEDRVELIAARRRPFTVSEYYRLAEVAILTEEDRVELIAGQIVAMSPIGSRHAACVDRLNGLLHRQPGSAFIVRVQSPIALDAYSEPEPDLVLLRPRADFLRRCPPRSVRRVTRHRSRRYVGRLRPRGQAAALRSGWPSRSVAD